MSLGGNSGTDGFVYEVVIPAWNAESFIAETIRSLRDQSVPPKRITVVDDGSTDDTARIASELGAEVVARERGGVVAARNAGLARVQTDFVAFVDADDLWEAHFAECVREAWRTCTEGLGALGTLVTPFGDGDLSAWRGADPDGRLSTIGPAEAWYANPLTASAIMFRTDALRSVDGWRDSTGADPEGSSGPIVSVEDYDLTLRLLAAGWTIARLGKRCARYRVRDGSWSSHVGDVLRSEELTLVDFHASAAASGLSGQLDLGTRLNRLWWRSIARAAQYRQPVGALPFPERSRPTPVMRGVAALLSVSWVSRLAGFVWRTWRRVRPQS